MKRIQITLTSSLVARLLAAAFCLALLLAATAQAGLNTSLVNGNFSTYDVGCYDGTVNDWLEQNIYSPNGAGIWSGCGPSIPPGSNPMGSFIPSSAAANQARIFQSLGTVDGSDVGKVFTFSGGAAAWDSASGRNNSGNIVASFRTGTTTSAYGSVIGKASTVFCALAASNGSQDGAGDDGNLLQPLSATFAPTAADIGKTIYAVLDLNCITLYSAGENYYVFDNLALTVTSGYPGLATTISNGNFSVNGGATFNKKVTGWMEHEYYGQIGPGGSGAGIWAYFDTTINGCSGAAMTFIPNATGNNLATVMQSLGFVSSGDVGKVLTLSCGTRAWDWYNGQGAYSGTVTASFRTGMSPDGETVDFAYGTLLGTAGSTTTGLSGTGNGVQDGVGDQGNSLVPLTATFTPAAGDVGKEVFVAINLNVTTLASAENRYVVDNVTLTVQSPTTLALTTSGSPSLLGSNVTFTATVQTNGTTSTGAGGSMVFKDNGTPVTTNAVASGVANWSTTSLTQGSHTITAEYSGDAAHLASTNNVVQLVNAPLPPTTTVLATSGSPSLLGGDVIFTATIQTNGVTVGDAGGTVILKDGLTALSTNSLAGGVAAHTNNTLAIGEHHLSAEYSGDANYAGSISSTVTQTVIAATTTLLTSSANPSQYGSGVTLTATVRTNGVAAGAATGAVVFKDGLTALATNGLSGGTATYNSSTLTVGVHSFTAEYSGDSLYLASTSPSLSQLVRSIAEAVLNNWNFETNSGAVFDPTVDGWLEHESYGGAGPNGSGCGIWPFFGTTISNASGGAGSLIAANTSVNTATLMQSLGKVDASAVGKNLKFSIGAAAWDWFETVKPFSGTVTVSFRAGCVPDNGNTANFNYGTLRGTAGSVTTGVTASGDGVQNGIGDDGGLMTLVANYSPSVGDVGTEVFAVVNLGNAVLAPSGESRFVVDNAALTAQTLTATVLASSGSPSLPGSDVTFTATIKTNDVTAEAATGTVEFRTNGVAFGSATVSAGVATMTTNTLPHGSNTVEAAYLGDSGFAGSTSSLAQVVNTPPVSYDITAGAALGEPVTVQIINGKQPPNDADGDGLIVSAVQTGLPNGVATTDGTSITYTPSGAPGTTHSFTYTVSDPYYLGTCTRNMSVSVVEANTGFNRLCAPFFTNGLLRFSYMGIPNFLYALEQTPTMSPPAWEPLLTNAVGPTGFLIFDVAPSATNGMSFFRTRYVSP